MDVHFGDNQRRQQPGADRTAMGAGLDTRTRPIEQLPKRVTRGYGFLESWLARWRAAQAERLIRPEQRAGRILDIGCGSFPYFLVNTEFAEKFGLDKTVTEDSALALAGRAQLRCFDTYDHQPLPFPEGHFDVVTMLAVFEHLRVDSLIWLITEIHRVLKPGGAYVMTTPSGVSKPVLDLLKTIGAVSREEIDEHQDSYSRAKVLEIMDQTPFSRQQIEIGCFEFGLNVWMRATREGSPATATGAQRLRS